MATRRRAGVTSRMGPVIARYSRPAMTRIWSDEEKLRAGSRSSWRRSRAGPRSAPSPPRPSRRSASRPVPPTPERVAEIERETNHDVAAFVDAASEALGEDGRWFHYGLTSSDVLDTALSLAVQDAGALVLEGARSRVRRRRRDAPRSTGRRSDIGRTHGVHAEPTTFGLKLAGWAFALDRDRDAARPRARGHARRQALRRRRHLRRDRPGGGAASPASGSGSSRRRARRRSCSATGTPSCSRRSRSSPRRSTGSRPRSATSRAPRCARSRSRSAAARRARRRCRTSATRSPPSGSAASRASCARTRSSASRTSRSGTSATSRTRRPSAIVLPDSFLAVDYMLDRFAWLVEGLVVRDERMRENLDASHGLVLQPAPAARARRVGARRATRPTGSCSATRCGPGTRARLPRRSSTHDPEIAGRVDLDAVFDLGAVHRPRRCRLRSAAGARRDRRRPLVSERRHASRERQGARDLRARRRPPAARRLRPDLDVRRRSCRRRSPTRAACSRGCPRSGSRARATIVPEPPARARRRRPLDRVPAAGDAAGRVRRARLSVRLGLGRLPARPARSAATRCRAGLRESDRLPEPIVTPATKADDGHDLNIDRGRGRRPLRRGAVRGGARRRARPLRVRVGARRGARHRRSPTRSSSSASTRPGRSCSATRR